MMTFVEEAAWLRGAVYFSAGLFLASGSVFFTGWRQCGTPGDGLLSLYLTAAFGFPVLAAVGLVPFWIGVSMYGNRAKLADRIAWMLFAGFLALGIAGVLGTTPLPECRLDL